MASQADYKDRQFLAVIGDEVLDLHRLPNTGSHNLETKLTWL
jgi:hypothetical protein